MAEILQISDWLIILKHYELTYAPSLNLETRPNLSNVTTLPAVRFCEYFKESLLDDRRGSLVARLSEVHPGIALYNVGCSEAEWSGLRYYFSPLLYEM